MDAGVEGWENGHRRRSGRWTLVVALVAVVTAARLVAPSGDEEPEAASETPSAVGEGLVTPSPATPSPTATPRPHPVVESDAPVFSEATGTVLLFDGGGETGTAIHLDSGARRRVPLDGQRAGDQPFRLWRMGDEVVGGWGEIYAVTPADGSSRHLGMATVFLPAAEPDQLWLIDYAGGAVGSGASTWTLIDASGEQLYRVELPFTGLEPVRGVPGGLAVRTPPGNLVKYDVDTGLTDTYGTTAMWLMDTTSERVVWCEGEPCGALHLSGPNGESYGSLEGNDEVFLPGQVWSSPHGHYIAAVVQARSADAVDFRLRIFHAANETVLADAVARAGDEPDLAVSAARPWRSFAVRSDVAGPRYPAVEDWSGSTSKMPSTAASGSATKPYRLSRMESSLDTCRHVKHAFHMKSRLRELREGAGLSQAELAAAVGVSRQTINAIERGRYLPSLPLAFQLARFFDMLIEEVFDAEH